MYIAIIVLIILALFFVSYSINVYCFPNHETTERRQFARIWVYVGMAFEIAAVVCLMNYTGGTWTTTGVFALISWILTFLYTIFIGKGEPRKYNVLLIIVNISILLTLLTHLGLFAY